MSEKNMEMMKKLIAQKKAKNSSSKKFGQSKNMKSGATANRSIKIGGSNNKV